MSHRSRVVKAGSLLMGGDWPVSIQTMWKFPLPAFSGQGDPALAPILERIASLKALGCDILRFAVPDEQSAESLGLLSRLGSLPLVADIHFDWRIALRCMDFPIAKLRINPGNIGARWKTAEVVSKAAANGIALRIGVNSGSLPTDLRDEPDLVSACIRAAEREIEEFEALGFRDYVVSMKLNEPTQVEQANRLFSKDHDCPLHLGVTEAGPLIAGVARNAAALVPLLRDGIGSTLRVSLSDSMESEVLAGREILGCAGTGKKGARIVSCPRCGRTSFDTHDFVRRWSERLYSLDLPLEVAVMGCVVNGPGEARHADIGITGAGDSVLVFRKGQIVSRVPIGQADQAFQAEIDRWRSER
ncbi:MAG TPA: (E)-4-hydroxy-3-methylbut-2-enyl-diphosphate synthase [Rectinemataceae bacterium]